LSFLLRFDLDHPPRDERDDEREKAKQRGGSTTQGYALKVGKVEGRTREARGAAPL
jgi:hypothetical protein